MKNEIINMEQRVFAIMKKSKPGVLFFIDQFGSLAKNATIRKALQRLTEKEKVIRVAQGIYVIPQRSKLVGLVLPGAEAIARAIAKKDHARIVPTGVQAMHLLGLTTQVPTNIAYLTDGTPRVVKAGRQTIKFKKTTPKNLIAKGEISGLVIQALKAIGKDNLEEINLKRIVSLLHKEKAETILHDCKLAPAWIEEIMKSTLNAA